MPTGACPEVRTMRRITLHLELKFDSREDVEGFQAIGLKIARQPQGHVAVFFKCHGNIVA